MSTPATRLKSSSRCLGMGSSSKDVKTVFFRPRVITVSDGSGGGNGGGDRGDGGGGVDGGGNDSGHGGGVGDGNEER